MDKNIWDYKNFNMVVELDIAGEFIYNGIQELNRMLCITNDAPTFFSLYNISVGIERLQKIVLVLWKLDAASNPQEFEKSLITHSHCGLNDEIKKHTKNAHQNAALNPREHEFISLINKFYKSARYNRFNTNGIDNYEERLFLNYLEKYITIKPSYFVPSGIIMSDEIKEFLGQVIGSISRKYYSLIEEGSDRNNTYTYELRSNSKAQKIFLPEYKKQSLMEGQLNERISFKEVLLYIKNSKVDSAFFKYMSDIPPLEFDPALIIEYLGDFSNNIIPQSLIDEVEHLYAENEYSSERAELVDFIGQSYVQFDYLHILKCNQILAKMLNEKNIDDHVIHSLNQSMKYIEEAEISDVLEDTKNIYKQFKEGTCTSDDFWHRIELNYQKYQIFIHE